MLTSIPILDDGECNDLRHSLTALRPHWVARTTEPAAFFTLGVASYQDLPPPVPGVCQRDYYREAPAYNALIWDQFQGLLDRVRGALQATLGAVVEFAPCLALPGFHIFEFDAIPRTDVASIHFDLQYQLIDWKNAAAEADFDSPISFTLPISLPRGGGGLNMWDLTWQETARSAYRDVATAVRERHKTFHRYTPGALVVHSGHQLHQIAGVADVRPGEQRITLQGHGIRRGEAWVIYW